MVQQQIENDKQNSGLARTEREIAINYGKRTEVRELVARIRAGLPGATGIPDSGIVALAQAAYAHDLDPWNGEVWYIWNEKRQEGSIMAGIKGWRKLAKRQMSDRQNYTISFRPVFPGSEDWQRYNLDASIEGYAGAVERAELCILIRSDHMSNYIAQLDKLHKITGSYSEARAIAGDPPRFVGLGVVRANDKSKMERSQLVQKRAEQHALKQAFDLPFAVDLPRIEMGQVAGWDNEEIVDGYAIEETAGGHPEPDMYDGVDADDFAGALESIIDNPVNSLSGPLIYGLRQYSIANSDVAHEKHWENRLKKHYGNVPMHQLTVTVRDFVDVMSTSHD